MGSLTVTSPNVPDIPFMPTGQVSLQLRSDGRFGEHDFTICPQVFSQHHVHRALVRARVSPHNSHLACIWWTPSPSDFALLPNSAYGDLGRCVSGQLFEIHELGSLLTDRITNLIHRRHGPSFDKLFTLARSMRHATLHLRFHPYTFRELVIGVAHAQRVYLDALALTDYLERDFESRMHNAAVYVQPLLSHVLGASSTDIETVHRLQLAGVPAYLVVPHKDALVLGATQIVPSPPCPSIAPRAYVDCVTAITTPILYTGVASPAMHDIMSLPPRNTSLDGFFFGLDNEFKIVPIGARGTVGVTGIPSSLSTRRKFKSTQKGITSFYICKLFLNIVVRSCTRNIGTSPA